MSAIEAQMQRFDPTCMATAPYSQREERSPPFFFVNCFDHEASPLIFDACLSHRFDSER